MSSDSANAQARALLQTLCKFMIPLIQTALGQTMDLNDIHFGVEADEFVIELETFISAMISRSQTRNQDTTIEVNLDKYSFYHSKGYLLIPEDETTLGARAHDEGNSEHISTNKSVTQYQAIPQSISLGSDEEVLGNGLRDLRKYVTQKMPIRLLSFEPQSHNLKLKISLLDRAGIYDHLALKFRTYFLKLRASPKFDPLEFDGISWWAYTRYAILSHTWTQTPGELTYGDWQKGPLDTLQPKCQKLLRFCKVAWERHGLTLGWIDTVCINKESSAELDESIRSMYSWYRSAEVCITYLAGTRMVYEMHNDLWFTRGWTLQELLAPRRIKFYGMGWQQLEIGDGNDKQNRRIQAEIERKTTITPVELHNISRTSISRRMQLAATRQVTREEDIAYCLMGIFDVSISTAYGEGAERAFFRLVEEIFRSTKDVSDIFNWADDGPDSFTSRQPITSLFPPHPSAYLTRSSNKQLRPWRPIEPLTLTHLGLRTPLLLMPAVPLRESVRPFPPSGPIGDYYAAFAIDPYPVNFDYFSPLLNLPRDYLLLDKNVSGPAGVLEIKPRVNKIMKITLTFGTLNVEEQEACIRIPKTCLAVLLYQQVPVISPSGYEKIDTKAPIVFDLKETRDNTNIGEDKSYYQIERSRLENHGMQLVTLYL